MKFNLPGVHGGISQQSPNLRLQNQHEDADNVLFDLLAGIRGPRWGTTRGYTFGAQRIIGSIKTTDGKVWFISWNKTTGALQVHDVFGNVSVVPTGATTYLTGADPEDLVVLPILDTAIVVNRKKPVATKADTASDNVNAGRFAYGGFVVPQVFEGLTLTVSVDVVPTKTIGGFITGVSIGGGSYTKLLLSTDTPGSESSLVRDGLSSSFVKALIEPNGGLLVVSGSQVVHSGYVYMCTQTHTTDIGKEPGTLGGASYWSTSSYSEPIGTHDIPAWTPGNLVYSATDVYASAPEIRVTTTSEFDVRVYSGILAPVDPNDSTVRWVTTTFSYETLPSSITSTSSAGLPLADVIIFKISDGYYVRYRPDEGIYEETTAPGQRRLLDKSTMPHELRWSTISGWTFADVDTYDTAGRAIGDSTSAPLPNFVNRALNYAFYYRNRLCFLADNYVAMSRVGQYYNWFPETATEVLDSDPIVVFPAHAKYSELLWAIPFSKQLVLLSATKQYVLHSGYDSLTPQTVAIDEATSYTLVPTIEPVLLPASMILPLNHNPYLGVLEYKLDDQQIASEGSLLSTTVPKFLPVDITGMVYVPSEHMVLAYKRGTRDAWVYKFNKREDGQLTQMAWSHWTLPSLIEYVYVHEGSEILFMTTAGRILFMDTSDDWSKPVLDYREEMTGVNHGDYILSGVVAIDRTTLKEYPISSTGYIDTYENPLPVDIYVGYPISWFTTLSPLILRDDNGLPRGDLDVTIENIQIDWLGGEFSVELTGQGLPSRVKTIVPVTTTDVGISPGASHEELKPTRVLIMAPAKRAVIKLKGTSYMSVQLNNLSYNLYVVQDWG